MDKVMSFFRSVSDNLVAYLALGAAATIAALVTALKIQGGMLHRAQVQLLDEHLKAKTDKADEAVEAARVKYRDALQEFLKAGGTLLLAVCLSLSPPARGAGPEDQKPFDGRLVRCSRALSACDQLVKLQQDDIAVYKYASEQWKKKAEAETPGFFQSVPWPVYVILGGFIGYGIARTRR